MSAPTLDPAVMKTLETLKRMNRAKYDAVVGIAEDAVDQERAKNRAAGGVNRRLLSRLQAVHDCPKPNGGAFEQIEPEYGVKRWSCIGCDAIVTLD